MYIHKSVEIIMIRYLIFAFINVIAFLPVQVQAAHLHPEKYYQAKWCNANNGIMEHRLADRTRVDCLTEEYAVEADFAPKWAEAVGQSLYYASMTQKKPAILLILENPEQDLRYQQRIQSLCQQYNIALFTIYPD